MPPKRTYKAGYTPVLAVVIVLSLEWAELVKVSPYVVKFGVLALLGALVSGLAAKDEDVRGSIKKGCAAVILGSVFPTLVNMWEVDERLCYILAFGIGLAIDAVVPLLKKEFVERLKKMFKVN